MRLPSAQGSLLIAHSSKPSNRSELGGNLVAGVPSGRHERQAQHILQHATKLHQALDAGGVAIDKNQAVELRETLVNNLGLSEIARMSQMHQLGKLGGIGITDNRNHTIGTALDEGQGDAIVA